ncbi:MAG: MetQ/NlpA family ABC transporter substrate-binding protein [Desulfitobacteriaceae bacterium]|nr:MetQ/NlpA family ABC transporter substrate-binding protein [Desulfitobacteriaceae bacterium]MDI6880219.1 MetQ/NlpA family ABC transporter substrate-binding protein [Desulfitobacteriaceae bacterium]MDI6913077.1 MetQ/NlpA family ABC transporter substrate-binding protein [Desulfitobacteriaceae bacterium]
MTRHGFQRYWVLLILIMMMFVLGGCSNASTPSTPAPSAQTAGQTAQPVKIGILPIEDNLPFYVADKDGLFKQAGIRVELVPFPSAVERDSALQAGQIDGEVADLVAVGLLKKGGTDVKVASIGLGATPKEGRFAILSSPKSSIRQASELKDVEIGVSLNSIIDYVTDQMLHDVGMQDQEIKKLSVPKMPVRVDMLLSDQLQAACLPDPLATLAEAKGAHVLVDDTYRNISQTVLLFRKAAIDKNLTGLQAVVRVYGQAGQALSQNPGKYRDLFIEKAQVPAPIKDTYQAPTFSKLQLPTEDEVNSVMHWMVNRKLLTNPYAYQDLVDNRLLPQA